MYLSISFIAAGKALIPSGTGTIGPEKALEAAVKESGLTMDQRKAVRNRNIVILALVIIIAVLCVIGIPALRSKSDNHMLFVQRMRRECDEAIRLTNTLSRNAGADSAGLLARIRSNVYSMDVINTLSINQDGTAGTLVPSVKLDSILN